MKLRFIVAAFAAFALASCSEPVIDEPVMDEEYYDMGISVSDAATRADGDTGELAVKTLQVFVFDSSGSLETYASSAGQTLSVKVKGGLKTFKAIVNALPVSGVKNISDLTAKVSKLTDNSGTNFIMEGSVDADASVKKEVDIEVKCVAAKVVLTKVTNNLSPAYGNLSFKLVRAYLINVVGSRPYFAAGTALPDNTEWLNKQQYAADYPSFTMGQYNQSIGLSNYVTAQRVFYCYPNPVTNDTSDKNWSPRYTRLVVEVQLGDANTTYYYPINLPQIASNKEYHISLVITKPGSTSPDEPYVQTAADVTVSIAGWEGTTPREETI